MFFTLSTENSYVTLEEAEDYFSNEKPEYSSLWNECPNKSYYLITATQQVDTLNYKNTKKETTQSLKFPRSNHSDIPLDVKIAVMKQVIFLLRNEDRDIHMDAKDNGVDGFSEAGVNYQYGSYNLLSIESRQYLEKYIVKTVRL